MNDECVREGLPAAARATGFAVLQRMNGKRFSRGHRFGTLFVAGALLSLPVLADQTRVYEWRDADGVKSYSQDPPPPGAAGVTVKEIDTRSLSPGQRAAVKARLNRVDAAQQAEARTYRSQVERVDEKVDAALRRLAIAERAMHQGRTPLAGERIGNAGGGSRLRAEYFDRQKALEDAVQAARGNLEAAYQQRAELMP